MLRLFEELFGDTMLKCCCNEQHQCCKESPIFHHQLQSLTILIMFLCTQHTNYSYIFTWTHNNVQIQRNTQTFKQQCVNTKKHTNIQATFYHMFCSKQCTTFEPLELLAQVLFQMVLLWTINNILTFYLLEDGRLKQSFDCIEY